MILGANGFIGSALTNAILRTRDWEVYGMDLSDHKLERPARRPTASTSSKATSRSTGSGSSTTSRSATRSCRWWPSPTPRSTCTHPLRVFELDFEANLDVVRQCVKYRKRLIFPSTSEVYGMSPGRGAGRGDEPAGLRPDRTSSAGSTRPPSSCSTASSTPTGCATSSITRCSGPFNFIGPNLDNIEEPKEGSSRVFTQFLSNMLYRRPIKLVDGGRQKRSFTYIDDAIECAAHHHREHGRARHAPHLQHRQSRQLRLDPRSRRSA